MKQEVRLSLSARVFFNAFGVGIKRILCFLKGVTFLKLSRWLLALLLLTFAFQIQTLVYNAPLFLSGNFNPYASFFLTWSDLLLVGSFFCWAVASWRKEEHCHFSYGDETVTLLLLLLLGMMLLNVVWVPVKILHLLLLFRWGELFLLYLLVVNGVLKSRQIMYFFLCGMAFQALVALLQYFLQSSVGLRMLGEPVASRQIAGVAKIDLAGGKFLRSFGTFAHANILGGALVLSLIFSALVARRYAWIRIPLYGFFGLGLLVSFSRSAFLALIVFVLMVLFLGFRALQHRRISWRWWLLGLSVALLLVIALGIEKPLVQRVFLEDSASNQERSLYLGISKAMLMDQPQGVGLGGFTQQMQRYTSQKLLPWLFQPVHNIFLLMGNEGGIAAGLVFVTIFICLLARFWQARKFAKESEEKSLLALWFGLIAALMVLGLFDHYLVSIEAGQVMLFLVFALASQELKRVRLPAKND